MNQNWSWSFQNLLSECLLTDGKKFDPKHAYKVLFLYFGSSYQ
jgi:hypothetical protein